MKNEIVSSSVNNLPIKIGIGKKAHTSPGLACPMHFHNELEFLFIHEGKMQCKTNEHSYVANKGDIIFINSRIPHETYILENNTYLSLIQFDFAHYSNDSVVGISRYLSRFINIDKEPVVIFKNETNLHNELSIYLNLILNEFIEQKPSFELYIKSNIYNILAFLSRNNLLVDSSTFFDEKNVEKIMPALEYIDIHYSEPITLESLSHVLNLNSSYFCRLFKRTTNSTFVEYLNYVRICKAERKLGTSTKSIGEISLDLGFASVSYFNKVFKKLKGCTPTEYRKIKYSLQ